MRTADQPVRRLRALRLEEKRSVEHLCGPFLQLSPRFLALWGPHFQAGDFEHASNLFAVIVGETDSGRSGTAAEAPRRLL